MLQKQVRLKALPMGILPISGSCWTNKCDSWGGTVCLGGAVCSVLIACSIIILISSSEVHSLRVPASSLIYN